MNTGKPDGIETDDNLLKAIENRSYFLSSFPNSLKEIGDSVLEFDIKDFKKIVSQNDRRWAAMEIMSNVKQYPHYAQLFQVVAQREPDLAKELESLRADEIARMMAKEDRKAQEIADMTDTVTDGRYSGVIQSVDEGVATQRIHPRGMTARHLVALLSEPVEVGKVVDIAYVNGLGVVKGQSKSAEKGIG